jgi:DNA-binding transcriptional LysR family regulator
VHAALTQLQAAVAPSDFDPPSSERRFAIVAGAYACAVLAPPLVSALAAEAPRSGLVVAPYTHDVMDRMDAHRVDFMIGGVVGAPERFVREILFTEELAWVVRAEHPLAQLEVVDLAALVAFPHVAISPTLPGVADDGVDGRGFALRASWEDAGAFETALSGQSLSRRVGVTVPDTYSALAVTTRSDMPALIPRRLAKLSAQSGRLALLAPPYQSPSINVTLLYLRDRLAEPAVTWMRDMIRATAATV